MRKLKSFGTAELLQKNATVFYHHLFSVQQLGRVSDLLAASIRRSKMDELRFRDIILLSFFQAYRLQLDPKTKGDITREALRLRDAVLLECGIDKDKVTIGVSFSVFNPKWIKLDGLEERIRTAKYQTEVEKWIGELGRIADDVQLRVSTKRTRWEIVHQLALPGREKKIIKDPNGFSLYEVEEAKKGVGTLRFVELGDVNYADLLESDLKKSGKEAQFEQKTVAPGSKEEQEVFESVFEAEKESKTVDEKRIGGVGGEDLMDNEKIVVRGSSDNTSEKDVVVKGTDKKPQKGEEPEARFESVTDVRKDEVIRVGGSLPEERGAGEKITVSASEAGAEAEDLTKTEEKLSTVLEKTEKVAKEVLDDLKSDKAKELVGGMLEELTAAKAQVNQKLKDISRSFRGKEIEWQRKLETYHEEVSRKEDEIKRKDVHISNMKEKMSRAFAQIDEFRGQLETKSGTTDYKGRYEKITQRYEEEQEKSIQLQEQINSLKGKLKQTERELEEQLQLGATAVMESKKKAPEKNEEKSESNSSETKENVEAVKIKLDRSEKLLEHAKGENENLKARIQQLKEEVDSTRKKVSDEYESQMGSFQSQFEQVNKQLDESKKQNRQLKDKLFETEKERRLEASRSEQMKKRAEGALRSANVKEEENAAIRKKLEESDKDMQKYKREVATLQNQIKDLERKLKHAGGGGGTSGSSGKVA